MTEKEKYEAIIGLLEKGVIYVKELDNGCVTIEPVIGDSPKINDITDKIDLDSLKGKYVEMAILQKHFENEEMKNELAR